MPEPTLQDYFGASANATVDASGDPVVVFYPKDFVAEGLAIISDPTTIKASRIVGALILKWRGVSLGREDDPTVGVIVGAPRKGLLTRGDVPQIEAAFEVSLYTPDNSPAVPDPDLIV